MASKSKSQAHSVARGLSWTKRRVLWELRRGSEPMTALHVQDACNVSGHGHGLKGMPYPTQSLRALVVAGYVRVRVAELPAVGDGPREHQVGARAVLLYTITPFGSEVAGWCYADGGVANA